MRITYFITGLGLGGAEIATIGLANKMAEGGHGVQLVYLSGINVHSGRVDPRVEVIGLGMKKTPVGFLQALRKARKIIRAFRPDIVHAHMFHAVLFARLMRLGVKIPRLIGTEHTKNIESKIRMFAYRVTDCLSDLNTNVSQEALDYFVSKKAFGKRKSRAMYNGIDTKRFSPSRQAGDDVRKKYGIGCDEFLWLNAGRLAPAKDQLNLLLAFKQMESGRLMIVGEGELREELERQIETMDLSDRVVMAGAHFDVENFYNAADCFVLSSAWEGFGMVLAEAMACGVPVISTDAGGCAEVVQNREFMVFVRRPDQLAEKMLYIRRMSREERAKIGEQNRSLSFRFDLDMILKQWEEIYNTI